MRERRRDGLVFNFVAGLSQINFLSWYTQNDISSLTRGMQKISTGKQSCSLTTLRLKCDLIILSEDSHDLWAQPSFHKILNKWLYHKIPRRKIWIYVGIPHQRTVPLFQFHKILLIWGQWTHLWSGNPRRRSLEGEWPLTAHLVLSDLSCDSTMNES